MSAPDLPYLGHLSARAAAEDNGAEGAARYRRVSTIERADGTVEYTPGLGDRLPARPERMSSEEYLARLRPSLDRQRSSRDELLAEEDAKEARSYALMNMSENIRNRQYYVALDSSALPTAGTRDEIPERHWYRYTWYRDLSNNHVVTGLLYNVLGLREIAHNRTTRDPNVKYRVPNTDWVLKQVAYGRTSVPEEFQFRYMWEGDVGTLVNTMGLQAFYDEGPTTRPPAPPQPPQPPPAAGVKNWQSQVQGLQSYINLERDTVDMYKRAIATFTNQMLASMNAGNFEAASGHQKDATEHLDKLISAQAKITDLERQKRLLLDTHMASPPPRPWERFEPGGPDDPAQPLYRAAGSQR